MLNYKFLSDFRPFKAGVKLQQSILRTFLYTGLCTGIFAFAITLSGCARLSPTIWVDSVSIVVDNDANESSATMVDIVVVHDQTLLAKLMGLTAQDYFQASEQIRRDNPGLIEIFRWEVVPGQCMFKVPVNIKGSSPVGGLVFARYIAPGQHRVRLGKDRDLYIYLQRSNFSVSAIPRA